MTLNETLEEFRCRERTIHEEAREYGKRGKTIKAAKAYSEALTWHQAAELLQAAIEKAREP